jgi:hypothetical protein
MVRVRVCPDTTEVAPGPTSPGGSRPERQVGVRPGAPLSELEDRNPGEDFLHGLASLLDHIQLPKRRAGNSASLQSGSLALRHARSR